MTARIKVGGVWKDVSQGFIKVSGAWKTISQAQIKVSGAWKSVGLGQVVQNGLQLLLDANDYSGSGNWLDTSGNNNYATMMNSGEFVASGDRSYFNLNYHRRDEGQHYMQLANGLDVQNDFTIGFWIRQNATQFRETMDKDVFIGNHNGFNSLSIYKNSGFGSASSNIYACAKEGTYSSPKLEFNNSDTGDDEIFNIVITRDNSFTPDRWTIFINGAKTNPITGATLNSPVKENDMTGLANVDTIGAGYDSSNFENDTLQGRVYHFMYYDTVLTDAQILQNYNVLKGRYASDDVCPLNTENLELYLNAGLDSSLSNSLTNNTAIPQGTIWYDLSGKSNNFGFGTNSSTTDTPNTNSNSIAGFDVVKPTTITSNVTGAVYIASHNDLITAFGTNVASGISHWTNNGLSEGRNIDGDVAAYLQNNPDLFAATAGNGNPFYTDLEQSALHLITYNSTEARSDKPHANIKSSLTNFRYILPGTGEGHARSELNADFFKFGETTDFTIGVWIRMNQHSVADGIISCGNVNHGGSFLLQSLNSGSYTASFGFRRNKASGVNNTDEVFNAPANSLKAGGRWQYIAVTCDRDTITKLYVDGFRVASDTDADLRTGNIGTLTEQNSTNLVSATDVDNVFRVGNKREENGKVSAQFGQVHVWKRCLSERQLLEAYNNTKAKYNHPQNLYSDG